MICKFSYKESPVYINASSIVGIMKEHSPFGTSNRTCVFCEDPMGLVVVEEDVETAFVMWYSAMEGTGEE